MTHQVGLSQSSKLQAFRQIRPGDMLLVDENGPQVLTGHRPSCEPLGFVLPDLLALTFGQWPLLPYNHEFHH